MIRRYLLVVALALLSSKALAQTGRTVHSIGFLGGSNTATYNGQQATFLYSGGEVVVQNGYIEIAKDQASVVSGMPFDISYFPVVFDRD